MNDLTVKIFESVRSYLGNLSPRDVAENHVLFQQLKEIGFDLNYLVDGATIIRNNETMKIPAVDASNYEKS